MILVDTSIWVDHLGRGDTRMEALLDAGQIIMHPFVVGEIALGNLRDRSRLIKRLTRLPGAPMARDNDVLALIERVPLGGTGIGLIDAHLLASVRLVPEARLWTRDKRLHGCAGAMSLAYYPEH